MKNQVYFIAKVISGYQKDLINLISKQAIQVDMGGGTVWTILKLEGLAFVTINDEPHQSIYEIQSFEKWLEEFLNGEESEKEPVCYFEQDVNEGYQVTFCDFHFESIHKIILDCMNDIF